MLSTSKHKPLITINFYNFAGEKKLKLKGVKSKNSATAHENPGDFTQPTQGLDNTDKNYLSTDKVEHIVDNNPSDSFLEKKENHQSSVRECSEADELGENVDTYVHAWGKKAAKMPKVEEDPEVYKRYKPKTTSSSTKLEEAPLDPLSNKEIKEIIGRPATGYNSMDDTDAHMYNLNIQDVPPRSYTMEFIKTHGEYYRDE